MQASVSVVWAGGRAGEIIVADLCLQKDYIGDKSGGFYGLRFVILPAGPADERCNTGGRNLSEYCALSSAA